MKGKLMGGVGLATTDHQVGTMIYHIALPMPENIMLAIRKAEAIDLIPESTPSGKMTAERMMEALRTEINKREDAGPFAIRVWKLDHWAYVGPHYATREIAKGWVSFVRSAWHGLKTVVVSRQQVEREKIKECRHGPA